MTFLYRNLLPGPGACELKRCEALHFMYGALDDWTLCAALLKDNSSGQMKKSAGSSHELSFLPMLLDELLKLEGHVWRLQFAAQWILLSLTYNIYIFNISKRLSSPVNHKQLHKRMKIEKFTSSSDFRFRVRLHNVTHWKVFFLLIEQFESIFFGGKLFKALPYPQEDYVKLVEIHVAKIKFPVCFSVLIY